MTHLWDETPTFTPWYPVWTPEPVPAIKQSGDLKVTLVDFVAGLHHEQEVEPKYRWYWISRSTTRIVFDVQQEGTRTPFLAAKISHAF